MKANDVITVAVEPFQTKISQQGVVTLEPQDIPLDIVFEDEDLLIVNKQAGLMVHPTPIQPKDTLINALLFQKISLSKGENEYRPGIVHRYCKIFEIFTMQD